MPNPWFKFYGNEYLADQKMLGLSACERSCWLTLLCLASNSDNPSVIKYLDEQKLMTMSGIDFNKDEWEETKGVLKLFEKLKMITLDNANDNVVITIINWQKRQQICLTPYERVKKYRLKQQNDNVNDNAMITTDKNRIDKNRIDKKESIEKDTPQQQMQEFINSPDKQNEIIDYLVLKGIDKTLALREIQKFIGYWTELNKSGTRQRWEMEKTFELKRRLTTWFNNIPNFQGQNNARKITTL